MLQQKKTWRSATVINHWLQNAAEQFDQQIQPTQTTAGEADLYNNVDLITQLSFFRHDGTGWLRRQLSAVFPD